MFSPAELGLCRNLSHRNHRRAQFDALIATVKALNAEIAEDETLGEGFCIGHSYFCNIPNGKADSARLSTIVNYELVPLLREYWYDEPGKVKEWTQRLRAAVS